MIFSIIYLIGLAIMFFVAAKRTKSGKMSFGDSPPETYGALYAESFLAATVWPAFLFAFLIEGGPKL